VDFGLFGVFLPFWLSVCCSRLLFVLCLVCWCVVLCCGFVFLVVVLCCVFVCFCVVRFLVCSVRVLVSVSLVFLRRVFLWFGFFLCARGLGKRCGLVVWWVVGGQLCRHGGCGVCFVE
jgi:hypothetical protein